MLCFSIFPLFFLLCSPHPNPFLPFFSPSFSSYSMARRCVYILRWTVLLTSASWGRILLHTGPSHLPCTDRPSPHHNPRLLLLPHQKIYPLFCNYIFTTFVRSVVNAWKRVQETLSRFLKMLCSQNFWILLNFSWHLFADALSWHWVGLGFAYLNLKCPMPWNDLYKIDGLIRVTVLIYKFVVRRFSQN